MKNSRFQFQYRKNASSLHKKVGEILRTSKVFSANDIYQEYPVIRVNPNYDNAAHHFDWVIPKLFIVIECHGKQHYTATSFTSNDDEAVQEFQNLKRRDELKKSAALQANYIYVEVPYNEEKALNVERLLELIEEGKQILINYQEEHPLNEEIYPILDPKLAHEKKKQRDRRIAYLKSEYHKEELKKAKEYRKQKYKALKEKRLEGENND